MSRGWRALGATTGRPFDFSTVGAAAAVVVFSFFITFIYLIINLYTKYNISFMLSQTYFCFSYQFAIQTIKVINSAIFKTQ